MFDYAERVGLRVEWLWLAWHTFVDRYRENGKRQRDWRQTFRNGVRDNWYRLWAIDSDGKAFLTSQGRAAEKVAPPFEGERREAA